MAEPQQARSRDTRQRLLDAAIDSLIEVGYARTTTVAVMSRAGVSRGSLLHQFPSREALLLAAMSHLVTEGMNDLSHSIGPEARAPEPEHIVEVLWQTFRMRYFWSSIELWVAARTDPDLRREIYPQARRLGQFVDEAFSRLFGRDHAAPGTPDHPGTPDSPGPSDSFVALRNLLISSMRGAALTYAFSPRDPADEPLLNTWAQLVRDHLARESSTVPA
ncbi:MAG: TetR/AcrR family transcriptional regulator [Herbiconiux sp.]|uniref:TetR/AcrR family transcriptional regulator n=1 Tax=Herbiconiux sp. TaxID=1871186 RepID=UPI00121F65E4|nr:TetR/AcrR family transcriptional regulator [Herbiconiux sp.]TAJ49466.1 MAG: TetR/AcrR family transcriptional regulator [Herbiconiux sp.]